MTAYSPMGGNPDYSGKRPREDPVVIEVADKYGKTVNQVGLEHVHAATARRRSQLRVVMTGEICRCC